MAMRECVLFGISAVCGLWWLSFPNSVLRFQRAIYGSRFEVRPFFIRLAGVVWIAVLLWMLREISKYPTTRPAPTHFSLVCAAIIKNCAHDDSAIDSLHHSFIGAPRRKRRAGGRRAGYARRIRHQAQCEKDSPSLQRQDRCRLCRLYRRCLHSLQPL